MTDQITTETPTIATIEEWQAHWPGWDHSMEHGDDCPTCLRCLTLAAMRLDDIPEWSDTCEAEGDHYVEVYRNNAVEASEGSLVDLAGVPTGEYVLLRQSDWESVQAVIRPLLEGKVLSHDVARTMETMTLWPMTVRR